MAPSGRGTAQQAAAEKQAAIDRAKGEKGNSSSSPSSGWRGKETY